MTVQDAAALVSVQHAEKAIVDDPTLGLWHKVQALKSIQQAQAAKPESKPWLTSGDIARGAVGAGLGYGAGTVLGKFLTVSPGTLTTMQRLGMGLGTLLNMGKIAMDASEINERDERNAFRYGFAQAMLDLGLFEKDAAANFVTALPLGPELISAPIHGAIGLGTNIASNVGALGGTLTAPDNVDEKMAKMMLEERALKSQADDLESQRHSAILRKILDRRYSGR